MDTPQANSCEMIDIRPPASASASAGIQLATLVKTQAMEVKRLILPKGREIPTHRAAGEITVQCLQGRVAFTSGVTTVELEEGRMLFLDAAPPQVAALTFSLAMASLRAGVPRPPRGRRGVHRTNC